MAMTTTTRPCTRCSSRTARSPPSPKPYTRAARAVEREQGVALDGEGLVPDVMDGFENVEIDNLVMRLLGIELGGGLVIDFVSNVLSV